MQQRQQFQKPTSPLNEFTTPKGTVLPLLNLQGKSYLMVAHRIMWFREEHPDWRIITHVFIHDEKSSIVRAEILDEKNQILATAYKEEAKFKNRLEKAETGAIGRALALVGYGTAFALADFEEDESSIADAPQRNVLFEARPRDTSTNAPRDIQASEFVPSKDYILKFGKNKDKALKDLKPGQYLMSYYECKLKRKLALEDHLEFYQVVEQLHPDVLTKKPSEMIGPEYGAAYDEFF